MLTALGMPIPMISVDEIVKLGEDSFPALVVLYAHQGGRRGPGEGGCPGGQVQHGARHGGRGRARHHGDGVGPGGGRGGGAQSTGGDRRDGVGPQTGPEW